MSSSGSDILPSKCDISPADYKRVPTLISNSLSRVSPNQHLYWKGSKTVKGNFLLASSGSCSSFCSPRDREEKRGSDIRKSIHQRCYALKFNGWDISFTMILTQGEQACQPGGPGRWLGRRTQSWRWWRPVELMIKNIIFNGYWLSKVTRVPGERRPHFPPLCNPCRSVSQMRTAELWLKIRLGTWQRNLISRLTDIKGKFNMYIKWDSPIVTHFSL